MYVKLHISLNNQNKSMKTHQQEKLNWKMLLCSCLYFLLSVIRVWAGQSNGPKWEQQKDRIYLTKDDRDRRQVNLWVPRHRGQLSVPALNGDEICGAVKGAIKRQPSANSRRSLNGR